MAKNFSFERLLVRSRELGVSLLGVSPTVRLPEREASRLKIWQESGHAGEMGYLDRGPDERCDPSHFEPWVKTVLSFAVSYSSGGLQQESRYGYGRVARYAWGKDYHKVLKKRLNSLGKELRDELGDEFNWRPVTDSFPLLERAYAERAGLGFVGKNTMLIRPKVGSFFFLAEVLTDLEFSDQFQGDSDLQGGCGTCTNCIDLCPTKAFVAPYNLDARKCISYLTIEKRGAFSEWESRALGDWIFGCDICQEVCPFNHRTQKEKTLPVVREFREESGQGGELSLLEVLKYSDDSDFREQFAGTPILRAKREGLVRNAISVALNQGFSEAVPEIETIAKSDPIPMIREHATWALSEFG